MTPHSLGPWDVLNTMAANLPAVLGAVGGMAGAYFAFRATQQNKELHKQGEAVIKATNGIQEAAIVLNRKDARAEGVIEGQAHPGSSVQAVEIVNQEPIEVTPVGERLGDIRGTQ